MSNDVILPYFQNAQQNIIPAICQKISDKYSGKGQGAARCQNINQIVPQQPGCAVFIPNGSTLDQAKVYFAFKLKGARIGKHNSSLPSETHDSISQETIEYNQHFSHTERQLVLKALCDQAQQTVLPDEWGNIRIETSSLNKLSGKMLVFTKSSTCSQESYDNFHCSCTDWYKKLKEKAPNITIQTFASE